MAGAAYRAKDDMSSQPGARRDGVASDAPGSTGGAARATMLPLSEARPERSRADRRVVRGPHGRGDLRGAVRRRHPVGPVRTIPEVARSAPVDRQMLVKMDDPVAGKLLARATIKMSKTPGRIGPVPRRASTPTRSSRRARYDSRRSHLRTSRRDRLRLARRAVWYQL